MSFELSVDGPITVSPLTEAVTIEVLQQREQDLKTIHADLESGGLWLPKDCTPVFRVAIVVPYRDRTAHLLTFLKVLLPVLKKQRIQFQIFVVEQVSEQKKLLYSARMMAVLFHNQLGNDTFNKGRLMNVGYQFISKLPAKYKCFIFHDVDLVPEDGRNMYNCGVMPKHMSPAVDTLQYM